MQFEEFVRGNQPPDSLTEESLVAARVETMKGAGFEVCGFRLQG